MHYNFVKSWVAFDFFLDVLVHLCGNDPIDFSVVPRKNWYRFSDLGAAFFAWEFFGSPKHFFVGLNGSRKSRVLDTWVSLFFEKMALEDKLTLGFLEKCISSESKSGIRDWRFLWSKKNPLQLVVWKKNLPKINLCSWSLVFGRLLSLLGLGSIFMGVDR